VPIQVQGNKRSKGKGPFSENVQDLLRSETRKLIWDDPELKDVIEGKAPDSDGLDTKWFRFVTKLTNKTLLHFGDNLFDHLSGANVLNIFQSIGSAAGLYTLLAPYFVSFSIFGGQKRLTEQAMARFLPEGSRPANGRRICVAHFTDTYYEINGVATTLQQQVQVEARTAKDLTVVTCDGLDRKSGEGVRIFPRGIDTQRFHPSKRNGCLKDRFGIGDGVKLLYVGRVSKEKNLQLLEGAFRKLAEKPGAGVYLIVVGDGPYLTEMQNHMQDLPCHFTGYLEGDELASLYASCDLFVFPSTTDTFGNVVLEAQASGIPVIVTDAGGPRENMIPGKTGIVVAANDEDSLYVGIQSLISSPKQLTQMGRAARRYMKDRSFESAFERTWAMYGGERGEQGARLAEAI
jgi:glycosyltransferase involved in cell wall biosynthesis